MDFYDIYKPYFNLPWNYEQGDTKNRYSTDQSSVETPNLIFSDSEDSSCAEDSIQREKHTALHLVDTKARHVRFKAVHVREYAVVVGDHPMCGDHLPLTLDWKHAEEKVYDISQYKDMRPQSGRGVRGKVKRLAYWTRRQILERVGPLINELAELDYEGGDVPPVDSIDILQDLRDSESLFDDNFCFPANMVKVQILEN
jgi:hypothetical protein